MKRKFTILCVLAAVGSGFYLFQTKNRAMLLDRDIARLMKSTEATRQHTGLLRAEYALLNDPGRLAQLAGDLLPELKTTAPSQFAGMADLEHRLPAVGAPPPPMPLEPQAPNAVVPRIEPARLEPPKVEPIKAEPQRPPAIAAATPRPAPVAPALPAPRPAVLANTPAAPQLAPAAPPVVVASVAAAPPRPVVLAPRPVSPPRAEPVMMRAPPATPAEAIARITRGEPVNPNIPAVASALGMARTMVPSAINPVQAATMPAGGLR